MTVSGHIMAQFVQAIHFSKSTQYAGLYPIALTFVRSIASIFIGQALTHKLHPLQVSVLKITLPFIRYLPSSKLLLILNDHKQYIHYELHLYTTDISLYLPLYKQWVILTQTLILHTLIVLQ